MDETAFWNNLAEKYAAQPVSNQAAYEHKLAETARHLTADMDVLEFGCGSGTTALIHAPSVRKIKGIDISSEMIRIARTKAEQAGITNADFEVQTIEDAPETEQYDAVLGMSILHLLHDRRAALDKICRLLKPGGLFFSSTACLKDGNPLIPLVIPIAQFFGKAPHVASFSADQLATELSAAGFEIDTRWRPSRAGAEFFIARKPTV